MNKRNVVKFNKDIKINAATCVIAAILLYVIICFFKVVNKEPITTYTVSKSNINNNLTFEGLIIRNEEVLNANKAGYVCYYIRDGEKVKKNSTVCTIDESGQVYNTISDSENYTDLLKDDYKDVRSLITLYKISYDNNTFYNAYNFENNVNNKVLELTNEMMMQQINDQKASGLSLSAMTSPETGLVTYYIDGYEKFDISSVKASDFDKSNYKKETLKSGDIISNNTPIVKIIPSEDWTILAPISEDQIKQIKSIYEDYIAFRINNSSYIIKMPYAIITGSDGASYLNISLNKYLMNFLSERFVSVEIILQDDEGLKIPTTSIVEKEVYQIPIDYFSAGGNQNNNSMLNVSCVGEDNKATIKQISPTIYKMDDEYGYVDPNVINSSDVLININNNNQLAVSTIQKVKISGVYSANRGIAEFRMVEKIKTIDDFTLIEKEGSITDYDNIILNSDDVYENQIIY